jgi:hypothetical protein
MKQLQRRWLQVDERYLLKSEDRILSSWTVVLMLFGFAAIMASEALGDVRPQRRAWALSVALVVGGGAFLFARWLRKPAPPVEHSATISFARLEGNDSFFQAGCICGWSGEVQETESGARTEALEHTPNMESEVEYPLGR